MFFERKGKKRSKLFYRKDQLDSDKKILFNNTRESARETGTVEPQTTTDEKQLAENLNYIAITHL